MTALFLELFNRSISVSYLVIVIILLRFIWKRAPKMFYSISWGLCAFRLVFPWSIESVFSLIPSRRVISPDILYSNAPTIQSGIPGVDEAWNPVVTNHFSPQIGASVNPLQIMIGIASYIWLIVMLGILVLSVCFLTNPKEEIVRLPEEAVVEIVTPSEDTKTVQNALNNGDNLEGETQNESAVLGQPSQMDVTDTVTIIAHIKEIYNGNTILISSDSEEFPGAFEVVIPETVYDTNQLFGGQSIKIEMYDTGALNENEKIPVYTAVDLQEVDVEETEYIYMDDWMENTEHEVLPLAGWVAERKYDVNTLEGVTLSMEKFSNKGGDVEIRNTTDMNIQYGEWYEIQKLSDGGKWLTFPLDIAFHDIAYNTLKNETVIWKVNWENVYGNLPKGTYRMIKDVTDFRGTGDYTKYYLADEFEIK